MRAKQPKPVHQLTASEFDAMFPDEEALSLIHISEPTRPY